MLTINGKTFMNLQEAVAWLLANNALPFQSTADFIANTEIAKSTIVNPSPTELKIGSLILFADGIVGTVDAITTNGFMVADEYTDLSDGVPHIIGISLNASQHLIFTMSEGDPIDAGLVKEISGFSIDASQHLIANYNDGTTQDLGAIFQGNISISGNLTVSGTTSLPVITSPNESISAQKPVVEVMSGYSANLHADMATWTTEVAYVGAVKNGNKLTLAVSIKLTKIAGSIGPQPTIIQFGIPASIGSKLYPITIGGYGYLDQKSIAFFSDANSFVTCPVRLAKSTNSQLNLVVRSDNLVQDTQYLMRYEVTFLLSDSLI